MKISTRLAQKFKIAGVLTLAGLGLLLPLIFVAAESGDYQPANIYLPASQTVADISFLAGANLDLSAQFQDDLYVAGSNVIISGPVAGDVIAVGSNVVINSEIKGNLRVVAANVTINGKIGKNATIAAGMVSLSPQAEIGQNLMVASGQLDLSGKVGKNIYVAGGTAILKSQIGGNAYLRLESEGSLMILPETKINGNLEYTAAKIADIKDGAQITGEEKFSQLILENNKGQKHTPFAVIYLIFCLVVFLGTVLVGLVLLVFLKEFTLKALKYTDKNIPLLILKGLGLFILSPIVLLILAATLIGLPLALILGAVYLQALFIGKIFVGLYVGGRIIKLFSKKTEAPLLGSLILGLTLIFILSLIPFLGWFIRLVVTLWGLGALAVLAKKELKLES